MRGSGVFREKFYHGASRGEGVSLSRRRGLSISEGYDRERLKGICVWNRDFLRDRGDSEGAGRGEGASEKELSSGNKERGTVETGLSLPS